MKKLLLSGLVILAFLGLPVVSVEAQQALDPGCSPDMWGYMQHQADAVRARNRAYEREILHRQQSTLYLTCYDQAMAMSAKLGLIFSDLIYPNPPPANYLVFPNVAYPDWGATQPTLGLDLNNVVNPVFNTWLIGGPPTIPPPALFNFLPQWFAQQNNQLGLQAIVLNEIMAGIAAIQAGGNPPATGTYNALVQQINALVNSMPNTPIQGLSPLNTAYTTMIAQLEAVATSFESTEAPTMGNVMYQLAQVILSFQDTCTREDDLWDKLDPAYNTQDVGVFYPPEGQYYPFTPYYTLKDFLTNNPPQSPPATPDFVQELGDATDSNALKQALNDLNNELDHAGQSPLWPAPPQFSQPNASAQDVINQM